MNQRDFFRTTAVIFSLITVLHILRLINSWEVILGGAVIPMWVSWLAVIIAGFLAYQSLKLSK